MPNSYYNQNYTPNYCNDFQRLADEVKEKKISVNGKLVSVEGPNRVLVFYAHLSKIEKLIDDEILKLERDECSIIEARICLLKDINIIKNEYLQKVTSQTRPDELNRIALNFCLDVQSILDKFTPYQESDLSLKPFFKNLLLCLLGIGLYSMGHKMVTGRYAFFDEKMFNYSDMDSKLPSQAHKVVRGANQALDLLDAKDGVWNLVMNGETPSFAPAL
ncbi:hypothetical protein [Legionella worsleiensis]|uniref:Uncharacterized protein n=1 Tax=Legionella worsleiensis TaxID=45076 RepID=A0A0W1A6I4_9GAMM|nr:hypothetical protein [Legionella worsleiensis]KTD76961.1 hypothetical protein Lwor_2186 [Legionella worsleiensis]STY33368.1 Uncharacterised protein [Legionella worsleiensis]